ncbi:MAG: serine/threonine-protein kinase [Candidatus Sulfotelmatobacter sp.]
MALANGTRLGPYEIVAALGAGGMGEVYRARDARLDRTVAIKILPPHFADDATRRQRFEREAKVVSGLNHPNICTLHDIGHQDGVDFIVMEFLEGESLAERLEKGPLPVPQVMQYGTQLASALDKAHRNGVTHRDLKPGNIILTKSGAKLLDFGLAKAEPSTSAGKTLTDATPRPLPMTKLGTIIGTVPYMSPEQLDGKEADARSDIFSLGTVLYEMVTGNRAFQGQSEFSVASAILRKDPPPISTLQPLTPPSLERTIRVCLAKDPDERWQSASDLWNELRWISEGGSQFGAMTALPSGIAPGAWRTVSPKIAWIVAALFAIIAAVALLMASRSEQGHKPLVFRQSPDGSQLAIIRELGGKDRLEYPIGHALREVSGSLSDVRFSPKGDRIAYFEHPRKLDDRGSVNTVDPSQLVEPPPGSRAARPRPRPYAPACR